jgi:predicted DNA-binding transcriptional regulator YafY
MNRMDRLFAILLQLQARGQQRAQDLAADFEVSIRTIYRDMQALSEAGVPVVALPGQGYGLQEGYFLPPLMFTALEAGALSLGAEYVSQTLDAPFRAAADSAQAKLANALTAEGRRDLQQLQESMRFIQPQDEPTHARLRELRDAILGRKVLRITYHAYGRPAAEDRDVEPYGLIHFGRSWHLLAYCRTRQAPRMFRLDRIDAVQLQGGRVEHTRGLSARTAGPPPQEDLPTVRVRAEASVVRWMREEHPHGLVREEREGEQYVLTFAVRDMARLARWLLQWGDAAEVLEPPELRQRLAEQGRRIALRHAGTPLHKEVDLLC